MLNASGVKNMVSVNDLESVETKLNMNKANFIHTRVQGHHALTFSVACLKHDQRLPVGKPQTVVEEKVFNTYCRTTSVAFSFSAPPSINALHTIDKSGL